MDNLNRFKIKTEAYQDAQPCSDFQNPYHDPTGLENSHICPRCGGIRHMCRNCNRDHHDGGWQSCLNEQIKSLESDKAELVEMLDRICTFGSQGTIWDEAIALVGKHSA